MASCTHVQWLRLHQEFDEFSIQSGSRLQNIARCLPDPSSQYPSLLLLVGKKYKAVAIRAIFPESRIARCRSDGIANVCIDPTMADSKYPILLADGPAHYNHMSSRIVRGNCHENVNHTVTWPDDWTRPIRPESLIDHIQARLLSSFIDVVCIFADDCGGVDGVIEKLTTWATIGSASSLPIAVRPRVVVVTSIPGTTFESEALRLRLHLYSTSQFPQSFSSLLIVNVLRGSRLSPSTRYSALKETLINEIQVTRLERAKTQTLFSMVHLAALFDNALRQFASSPQGVFHFIESSRVENPVTPDFQNHLKLFLQLCMGHELPSNVPIAFIASAILLDAYPPEMHHFNPSDVFRALYRPLCLLGLHDFADSQQLSSESICADIEAHMIALFTQMEEGSHSASAIRRQSLRSYSKYLALLKTMQTCLFCLRRMPEQVIECGHSICEACICSFGIPKRGREYCFVHDSCVLCEKKVSFEARLLPPTCRVRFISIDGGGSRAVVPLQYIDAFQQVLNLPYPIQEHFDFGIGTSSGGLVILALFVNYWDTKKCLVFFKRFARRVFRPNFVNRHSLCGRIRSFFASYLADGRYDAARLETTLQEAFGSRPLFDSVRSRPSGMKIAVTATTIYDATLCLFSNYNGLGSNRNLGYIHRRALEVADEISVWEAARCTTAAPSFFKTKYLPIFGTFQDGAMRYNNPVKPGLREVTRIWRDGDCDLVLSIGTGFKPHQVSPTAPHFRGLLQDGFLFRSYRAFVKYGSSLLGQRTWEEHWNGLDEEAKGHHFRLDLPITGREPGIDEVDKMDSLQDQVPLHLGDLEGLARAFKAVDFFFELDGPMILDNGLYHCRGSILCRSPNSRALVQNLTASYPYSRFVTNSGTSFGFLSLNDNCPECGRFYKPATFSVRHPTDIVNIFLVFNRLFRRSISGFPHSMDWFENRQMLKAQFGRPDHKTRFPRSTDSSCCIQHRGNSLPSMAVTRKRGATSTDRRRSKRQCLGRKI